MNSEMNSEISVKDYDMIGDHRLEPTLRQKESDFLYALLRAFRYIPSNEVPIILRTSNNCSKTEMGCFIKISRVADCVCPQWV